MQLAGSGVTQQKSQLIGYAAQGGRTGIVATVSTESFHPAEQRWQSGPDMIRRRTALAAATLQVTDSIIAGVASGNAKADGPQNILPEWKLCTSPRTNSEHGLLCSPHKSQEGSAFTDFSGGCRRMSRPSWPWAGRM